jgi:tetratricopeptide (TPR) repeat protein
MTCWCEGKCPHIAAPQAAIRNGQPARAMQLLRNALTQAPYCLEGNLSLAGMLAYHNHAQEAEIHIDRAAHYGEPGRIAFERANILRHQMRLGPAIEVYAEALKLQPDNANVAAGFASAVEMSGNITEAWNLLEAAETRFPGNVELRRIKGVILSERGDYEAAIEVLASDGPGLTPVEWLDKGRYYEKLGQYRLAWECWMKGKEIARVTMNHHYNKEASERHFAALRLAATPPRPNFYRAAPLQESGPSPIFVCGFPRSGTTLMETILSAHSKIAAGDEMMGVHDAIEMLPAACKVQVRYPAAMLATSLGENQHVPAMLRDLYLASARRRISWPTSGRKVPRYFTDKMPLNDMHYPFIRLLFPDALVIRMRRHPLDVMVSCISQWMAHGGFFASSLEACAHHYKLTDDLALFYRADFMSGRRDEPRLDTLSYENLVEEPAGCTSAILKFLDLKWEARCATPHKNKRHARTLSYNQVRKPMNTASIGRWKNFRDQLAPAIEILKPVLEREGYEY